MIVVFGLALAAIVRAMRGIRSNPGPFIPTGDSRWPT